MNGCGRGTERQGYRAAGVQSGRGTERQWYGAAAVQSGRGTEVQAPTTLKIELFPGINK
jgi:hypothetical protein